MPHRLSDYSDWLAYIVLHCSDDTLALWRGKREEEKKKSVMTGQFHTLMVIGFRGHSCSKFGKKTAQSRDLDEAMAITLLSVCLGLK